MKKHKLSRKLAAYSLAAGAAVVVANVVTTQAVINHYESPVGPDEWYVDGIPVNSDMITFKMDGTVVLNDTDLPGLQILGQDDDSFTLTQEIWWWYGADEKHGNNLHTGANVGFVGGTGYEGAEWDVGRLGGGYTVDAGPLADSRVWSDHAVTSTGGLGGWNYYFHGEWPFGGGGYLGLYVDSGGDRFYGWANVYMGPTWHGMRLNAFAFETTPNLGILTGDEGSPGVPGDFTGEGDVNAADIDVLCDNMGSPDPLYDLDDGTGTGTPDGVVDDNDLIYHIEELVEWDNGVDTGNGTKQGDFNLDGVVNATDLAIMKSTFGTSGVDYADGNANCDDVVNATDLAILKDSFGFVAPTGGGVPEPATLTLLALGATGLMARRRRN